MPDHRPTGNRSRMGRNLAVIGAGVAACAAAGSLLTDPDGSWYQKLTKPSWQPPKAAFPIVWTSLYAVIALSAARTVTDLEAQGRHAEASGFKRELTSNLLLNAGWSGLFFRAHNLPAATAGAAALAASSAKLARRAGSVGSAPAVGLGVYAAWCAFATALSGKLAELNPDDR